MTEMKRFKFSPFIMLFTVEAETEAEACEIAAKEAARQGGFSSRYDAEKTGKCIVQSAETCCPQCDEYTFDFGILEEIK